MTTEELHWIEAKHEPYTPYIPRREACKLCRVNWPCQTARLVAYILALTDAAATAEKITQ